MVRYEIIPDTSQVFVVFDGSKIGTLKFWIPEGVQTPRGLAGVYPSGMEWVESEFELRQEATIDEVFGPGNVTEVEPGILECCGIRYIKEAPLPWTTSLTFHDKRLDIAVSVHNPHDHALPDVCAVLCLTSVGRSTHRGRLIRPLRLRIGLLHPLQQAEPV